MRFPRGFSFLPLGMAPSAALAAGQAPQPSSFAALAQALIGLVVVLALLYGFFWLLRRFGPTRMAAQGAVKVVGGVMLGPRERLVVVEVRDTWLLVGVAAGTVSTLHTLPKPETTEESPPPAAQPFAGRLADLLKRSKG